MNQESKKQKTKRWRIAFDSACRKRDNNKCKICGRANVKLSVHHIKDRHTLPNDGYVVSNGITLCDDSPAKNIESCHMKAEKFHYTNGREFTPGFHPNDLYKLINSSEEKATADSKALR